ncbi:MAG: hormogonium polysaccharide secretion pseudopilin HpsB [Roseofilum sp. SBFL]|uniref:hormogonium polysaccharide secretion pseudopilin HpsB n=1 Tax=unclassified Roseofilum TaxID=2620099 RepID=UPI001AFE564F|nr:MULTISPECIES: hormogonium polysaccharide secretion pseudopilin HpsB [unclassified Roseofilum]MBP0013763.1 hormogonium polysaccharide secretion pseudopilin HpsB [Roseofilum sp. SID3]MBP0026215.1 hormogonium polysaccharide secretion pseudopilin HpsB [Roseofilum sp. SID2]MBP0040611.1 hormogonium polysaccharide secretion pseudopilin HpsB [Roseofilum sp. SBFL]
MKPIFREPKNHSFPPKGESGFTLIESLVAVVILTIMLVGIAPVIVLATATRIQARRVELATQAARFYIDGVRAGSLPAPNSVVELKEKVDPATRKFISKREDFAKTVAPAQSSLPATCPPASPNDYEKGGYCKNQTLASAKEASATDVSLYCFDGDDQSGCQASSPNDFIVQAYRSVTDKTKATAQATAQGQLDQGYLLGIRVYRADAFKDTGTLLTLHADGVQQRSSGATLNVKAPLLEMTTEIQGKNDNITNFNNRFKGG